MHIDRELTVDLDRLVELLKKYPLCNHCLGRVFAKRGLGLGNDERGFAIKVMLQMYLHEKVISGELDKEALKEIASNAGDPIDRLYERLFGEKPGVKKCFVCSGKISREYFEDLAERVGRELVENDARSFLVGVSLPRELSLRELEVYRLFNLEFSESIKNEVKREVGKSISRKFGLSPDFENPDAIAVVDFETGSYSLVLNSILLEGRYWKRGRRISQIPWTTRADSRKYPYSVQDFVIDRLSSLFKSSDIAIHASGREDVDARMLGSGRPLVVEVRAPRSRRVNFDELNEALRTNLVEVRLSSQSSRLRIKYFKEEGSKKAKVYKLLVYSEREVRREDLESLEEFFRNRVVKQYTPRRVARRGEALRTRRVYEVKSFYMGEHLFETIVHCDGGLYVKELVHGDGGRTSPSYAEFLGCRAYPLEIDVLAVLLA